MTAALALAMEEDLSMTHEPERPEILATATLHVTVETPSRVAVWVELERDVERGDMSLTIGGHAIEGVSTHANGDETWELRDPGALRALADALTTLAERAERDGWL